jgi:tRNA(fMet)-specific endonuclease VapC
MAVLDSDLLIAYLRGKENADELISDLRKNEFDLNTTVFNSAELYKGCYAMRNVAKGLMKVKALLETLDNILPFNEKAIQEYAKISADLKKRGSPIGVMDELIASICIAHNESFYTGNVQHFERVEDLNIINWSKFKKEE